MLEGSSALLALGLFALLYAGYSLLRRPAGAVLPAAFAGFSLASRLFRRVSHELLLRPAALLLFATGGSLIVRALG